MWLLYWDITTYNNYMHLTDKSLQKAAMRHPMVRKNVDPKEIIRSVKETIENFHLESGSRFNFSISQDANGLSVNLYLK